MAAVAASVAGHRRGRSRASAAMRDRRLSGLHLATIEALALAIDAKDQTTSRHIRRVEWLARALAHAVGLPDDEVQGIATAAAAPRHRQARRARAHPLEARAAHRRGVPEGQDPPAGGLRDHRARPVPVPRGAAGALPPRALGRNRLPARPARRGHPARRPHPGRGRLLRLGHARPSLQQADVRRAGAAAAPAGVGQGARSEPGVGVPRTGAHAAVRRPGPGRVGRARCVRPRPAAAAAGRGREDGVREHRAGPPGDLRAVRDRAGHRLEPRRGRHDVADRRQAHGAGALLVLRALRRRRRRHRAVPLLGRRGRRRTEAHPASGGQRSPRLGHRPPAVARERVTRGRLRGRRSGDGRAEPPLRAHVPAGRQRPGGRR